MALAAPPCTYYESERKNGLVRHFYYTFIIVFLLIFSKAYSQQGWVIQNTPSCEKIINILFLDETNGYALTNYNLFKTSNSGLNWNLTTLSGKWLYPNLGLGMLEGIQFLNKDTGFVLYGPSILKTTDGSGHWKQIMITGGLWLNSFCFTDKNTGYVSGTNGIAYKTYDGGENWISLNTPGKNPGKLYFLNNETGFLISGNNVCKTINGGIGWDCKTLNNFRAADMFFINNDTGYISGDGILLTTDHGDNWKLQNKNDSIYCRKIIFINNNTGFAIGFTNDLFFVPFGYGITKTTDGGNTWKQEVFRIDRECEKGTDAFSNRLESIYFLNENTGYIGGDWGIILKTTTGGE